MDSYASLAVRVARTRIASCRKKSLKHLKKPGCAQKRTLFGDALAHGAPAVTKQRRGAERPASAYRLTFRRQSLVAGADPRRASRLTRFTFNYAGTGFPTAL